MPCLRVIFFFIIFLYSFILQRLLPLCRAASLPLPSPLHGVGVPSPRRHATIPAAASKKRKPKRSSRKRVVTHEDEDDPHEDEEHDGDDDDEEDEEEELTIRRPKKSKRRQRSNSSRSMWPPWPFNMLQAKPKEADGGYEDEGGVVVVSRKSRSAPFWVWLFARESTRTTLDRIRQVASQLWFHLPPGMPPFVLLAMVPRRVVKTQSTTTTAEAMTETTEAVKRAIPLFANNFARSVALSGLGLAIMSWAHYEIHRKRALTPLPLTSPYRDLYKIALPPFLPEEVQPSSWQDNDILTDSATEQDEEEEDDDEDTLGSTFGIIPRNVLGKAPTPQSLHSTLKEWQRMRARRKDERRRAHRLSIQDQLLAIQAIKSRAAKRKKSSSSRSSSRNKTINSNDDNDPNRLGYALVTGASRGIGRAIAVELARYEIPLILVARDAERLTNLAYDIESCYGVRCCILAADLSKPGEAERVHNATSAAGLKVDILVNNAGYSLQGESMDFSVQKTNNLIQLNALSLSSLTHLYGKDMKERRRGRILMMSSICGATAGIPSVAVYAATKSFVNTLSLSLAQELEQYGCGVTLVMPGAVKDTEFKSRSDTHQALCWKIPFYPKTPQRVAESSIKALLRGETECAPGWENRFFLKIMKPAVPQRIHNIIAEIFWNPFHWPLSRRIVFAQTVAREKGLVDDNNRDRKDSPPATHSFMQTPQRLPRLLLLEDETAVEAPDKVENHDGEVKAESEPEKVATPTEDNEHSKEVDLNSLGPPDELDTPSNPPPLEQEETETQKVEQPSLAARTTSHPLAFLSRQSGFL